MPTLPKLDAVTVQLARELHEAFNASVNARTALSKGKLAVAMEQLGKINSILAGVLGYTK